MKILLDMNLSPEWCDALEAQGFEAIHWSTVGNPRAADRDIMVWAYANGFVVFTHDLDFSAILAATQASGPSVIQLRTQDPTPSHIALSLAKILRRFETELAGGAIVVISDNNTRVRILPLNK